MEPPAHLRRPPDFTDEEWAEYLQCQDEYDDLLAQVADREAQIEMGHIDSYEEYTFTWEYPNPAVIPPSRPAPPSRPDTSGPSLRR